MATQLSLLIDPRTSKSKPPPPILIIHAHYTTMPTTGPIRLDRSVGVNQAKNSSLSMHRFGSVMFFPRIRRILPLAVQPLKRTDPAPCKP